MNSINLTKNSSSSLSIKLFNTNKISYNTHSAHIQIFIFPSEIIHCDKNLMTNQFGISTLKKSTIYKTEEK